MAEKNQDVDELMPEIQSELRRSAGRWLQGLPGDYTLQPTAIVNEVYARLTEKEDLVGKSRTQFLAMAAKAVRWVFLDQVRKRHPAAPPTTLPVPSDVVAGSAEREVSFLALHAVLHKLEKLNDRQATIVELRFFGGMTVGEVAEALGESAGAVEDDWAKAWTWLGVELKKELER